MNRILIFSLLLALALSCSLAGCGCMAAPASEDGSNNGSPSAAPAAADASAAKTDGESAAEGETSYEPIRMEELNEDEINRLLQQGFELVPEPEPYNPTEAELVEALFADNAFYDEPPSNFSPNLSEMAKLKGETVQFSTEPWEDKEVEFTDFTENMSPEDKAAWEEMKNMDEAELEAMQAEYNEAMAEFGDMGELVQLEDGTWTIDGVEGMEDMPSEEEIQQQIDEAMGSIDRDELQKQLDEAQKELEGMDLPEGYGDMLDGIDLDALLGGLQ